MHSSPDISILMNEGRRDRWMVGEAPGGSWQGMEDGSVEDGRGDVVSVVG
jgi:hypothetical protein